MFERRSRAAADAGRPQSSARSAATRCGGVTASAETADTTPAGSAGADHGSAGRAGPDGVCPGHAGAAARRIACAGGPASDAGTSPRSPWLSSSGSPCGPACMAVIPRNRRRQAPSPPPAAAAPSIQEAPAAAAATDPSAVLHEEIPDVSAGARATIRGHIQVAVRVTVDGAGNVTDAALTNPGSSKYFARLATDAARKWKFAPASDQDPRKRLLIFEFSRSGVAGHASPTRS